MQLADIERDVRESRQVAMKLQTSQRGKQYLQTARTLLRVAQTVTDEVVASRLKALTDDMSRRAEKASVVDAAKALARSPADAAPSDW